MNNQKFDVKEIYPKLFSIEKNEKFKFIFRSKSNKHITEYYENNKIL